MFLKKYTVKQVSRFAKQGVAIALMMVMIAVMGGIPVYAASGITVTVKDGGATSICYAMEGELVSDLLTRIEKTPGKNDIIDIDPETPLAEGDVINITRINYKTRKESKVVEFETIYRYSPDVKAGDEKVVTQGSDGKSEFIYEQVYINGELSNETLMEERVAIAPVNKEIEMGFRTMPVSRMDFDAEFDENGEPINYSNVLRGQRSAGYSARDGAGTASGIALADVGYVAVNPKVIPYGSKLFIQTDNGKFIYGYAIAADTGIALMDGRIAVDCFYDTYEESANHGIKNVDIFILE